MVAARVLHEQPLVSAPAAPANALLFSKYIGYSYVVQTCTAAAAGNLQWTRAAYRLALKLEDEAAQKCLSTPASEPAGSPGATYIKSWLLNW